MAFLLEPSGPGIATEQHAAWIDAQHRGGRLVLAVNANYFVTGGSREERNGEVLAAAYANGLRPLLTADEPVSLILIPHDHRSMAGRFTDLELLQMIATELSARDGQVRVVANRLDAAEVKELVGRVDAAISGRMHLAIAALGQAVPAAGITYQGKFRGLYEHLDLEDLELTAQGLVAGELTGFLASLLARRQSLVTQLHRTLPRVRQLASVSFDSLLGTLDQEAP